MATKNKNNRNNKNNKSAAKNAANKGQNNKNRMNRNNSRPNQYRNKNHDKAYKAEDPADSNVKEAPQVKDSPTNDDTWYSQVGPLLQNVANYNFVAAVGKPIDFNFLNGNRIQSVPGLQVLRTIPTLGWSVDRTSAANVAAVAQYSWIRRNISGTLKYDPVDVIIHEFALTQAYQYINWLFRIYGEANVWSLMNQYIPDTLLRAEGVNPRDVRKNLNRLKTGINQLVMKVAQFMAPKTMPIYLRQAFMYSGVYQEGDTVKDQMYMYAPAGFYIYTTEGAWPNVEGKCVLDTSLFDSGEPITVDKLLDFGDKMLDSLLSQEDVGTINGNLISVYGTDTFKVSFLPDNFMINPSVPDLNVLEQMKNATIIPFHMIRKSDFTIHQGADKAFLVQTPAFRFMADDSLREKRWNQVLHNYRSDLMLSTILVNPNPGQLMERTRLMAPVFDYSPNDKAARLACGSEIVVACEYYYNEYVSMSDPGSLLHKTMMSHDLILNDITGFKQITEANAIASSFKFHPSHAYWSAIEETSEDISLVAINFDVDNYTMLSPRDVQTMHDTALLSLYGVQRFSLS